MEPRRHHYLPEFYLGKFTNRGDATDMLFVVDVERQKTWRQKPKELANIRDFYRIDVEGLDPFLVEKELSSKIETKAASVIADLEKNPRLPTGEDFEILMNFVATLAVRGPAVRNSMTNFGQQVAERVLDITTSSPEIFEAQAKKLGMDLTEEDRLSFRASLDEGYAFEQDQTRLVMQSLAVVDGILPCLADRQWSLLIATGTDAFVTCDRPVSLSPLDEAVKGMPLGFGLSSAAVTVPLTKRLCLRGVFDEPGIVFPLPSQLVAGINTLTITYDLPYRVYAKDDGFRWIAPNGREAGAQELLSLATEETG